MNIIAQIITAANVVFGIKRNELVKKPNDNKTRHPVIIPPNVVRTPLALLTAVRVNDPVTGIDWKNEPTRLHIPSANISCVASMVLPLAVWQKKYCSLCESEFFVYYFYWFWNLQNALATAMLSSIEINGRARMVEPTCVSRSVKWSVLTSPFASWIVVSNGGTFKSGNPDSTWPKK